MKNKVRTVMKEFKSGDLKSSSGKKVTNPKQAIAIALSEAGKSKSMKEGGHMKESKEMMKKEVSFMKKKGAPKSMIKHEMKEAGMKKMALGGMAAGMARGMGSRSQASSARPAAEMSRMAGMARSMKAAPPAYGKNPAPAGASRSGMLKKGGAVKKMALGGMTANAARGMGVKLSSAGTQSQMQAAAQAQRQLPRSTPRGVVPQQLTPQQSRLAEATYKQYQQQKQLANSVGNMGSQSASNQMRGVIGPLAAATARGMMKKGGAVKKMAGGGLSAGHKSADGVAKKGKTDTKQVAMKKGGAVKKMRYGGKC